MVGGCDFGVCKFSDSGSARREDVLRACFADHMDEGKNPGKGRRDGRLVPRTDPGGTDARGESERGTSGCPVNGYPEGEPTRAERWWPKGRQV